MTQKPGSVRWRKRQKNEPYDASKKRNVGPTESPAEPNAGKSDPSVANTESSVGTLGEKNAVRGDATRTRLRIGRPHSARIRLNRFTVFQATALRPDDMTMTGKYVLGMESSRAANCLCE